MNRIAARVLAGAATMAVASALTVSAASAATATLTVKVSDKPIVSVLSGASVHDGIIQATASVAGTVSFATAPDTSTAGTVIKGCEAVATAAAAPFTANCPGWQPAKPGVLYVVATLTPSDATIAKVTTTISHNVGRPINENSTQEGISLYVDTVNGSSTPVTFTDGKSSNVYLPSGGCLLMNQFLQGQQIVFRVYANQADGTPLTGQNAALSIKIAGWDTPVALAYGDHSGTAFWAVGFNTGKAGSGLYSTPGVISYTIQVQLLDKPAVTKDVTSTKFVKVIDPKTKKALKVNGAYVWKPTTVKSTVVVTPAVVNHTLSFSPAAWQAAASVLTLSTAK